MIELEQQQAYDAAADMLNEPGCPHTLQQRIEKLFEKMQHGSWRAQYQWGALLVSLDVLALIVSEYQRDCKMVP